MRIGSFSLLLFVIVLPILAHSSYGQSELSKLQIVELRTFDHQSTTLMDYHPNQNPITELHAKESFVVNALIRNQNHTTEHFDLITEVFDKDGRTVYLYIRNGVAVNLGGQIPIDSAGTPINLNETGQYLVSVFTWRTVNEDPVPLSEASRKTITILP